MVTIRGARIEDVPVLLRIRHAALAAHAPSVYTDEQVATLLADVDTEELSTMATKGQLFVAELDHCIVGLAGWRANWLRHVYVNPGRERQGIGTALVRRVEEEYRRRTGADHIELWAVLYAKPFYEASGYVVLALETGRDGGGSLRMAKRF